MFHKEDFDGVGLTIIIVIGCIFFGGVFIGWTVAKLA